MERAFCKIYPPIDQSPIYHTMYVFLANISFQWTVCIEYCTRITAITYTVVDGLFASFFKWILKKTWSRPPRTSLPEKPCTCPRLLRSPAPVAAIPRRSPQRKSRKRPRRNGARRAYKFLQCSRSTWPTRRRPSPALPACATKSGRRSFPRRAIRHVRRPRGRCRWWWCLLCRACGRWHRSSRADTRGPPGFSVCTSCGSSGWVPSTAPAASAASLPRVGSWRRAGRNKIRDTAGNIVVFWLWFGFVVTRNRIYKKEYERLFLSHQWPHRMNRVKRITGS